MTTLQFAQLARLDFIAAGPEGHYQCPAMQVDGDTPDGRLCVAFRASDLSVKLDADFPSLEDEWFSCLGEQMIGTNERGYAACVAAYDQLILTLESQTTPPITSKQEITA